MRRANVDPPSRIDTETLVANTTAAQIPTQVPTDVRRALALANWTDRRFIDPLLGFLLPGAGDALGVVAGLYIVMVAHRHGAPRSVLVKMMLNLGVDCLAGVIPIAGDVVDLLNRANLRNARLLQRHLAASPAVEPMATNDAPPRSLMAPAALLVVAIGAALAIATLVARRLFE